MIVNIGLPRTATTSFCEAYRLLGYQVQHGPVTKVDYNRNNLVLADTPWWVPGTPYRAYHKLVWTYRDYESWEASMLDHFRYCTKQTALHPMDEYCYSSLFECYPFPLTKKKLRLGYDKHTRWAEKLVCCRVNLCDKKLSDQHKWSVLIEASGKDHVIPHKKFPHKNATGRV